MLCCGCGDYLMHLESDHDIPRGSYNIWEGYVDIPKRILRISDA